MVLFNKRNFERFVDGANIFQDRKIVSVVLKTYDSSKKDETGKTSTVKSTAGSDASATVREGIQSATRSMKILCLVFCFSYLPYVGIALYEVTQGKEAGSGYDIAFFLGIIQPMTNAVILMITHPALKKRLREVGERLGT